VDLRAQVTVFALLFLSSLAPAQEVQRYVIALVPGAKPDIHLENPVHEILETPINHLGLLVRHHYIQSGPPPADVLDGACAVLTWFGADTKDAAWLWPWLEDEVAPKKLRVIHFGDYGPLQKDGPRLERWLARFGLQHQTFQKAGPYGIKVEVRDAKLCALEEDPRLRSVHAGPRSTGKNNRPWITTTDRSDRKSICHPVVTGPWGAVALNPWTVRSGGKNQDRRWHLDPFPFFREALGMERVPAPHPAVLNGRRMWFLQVDGDGFESLTSIKSDVYAAQVMKEDVFERYALPYTVSIVCRSLTPDLKIAKPTAAMKLAREIFRLPNVEPASHGVLHTLEWQQELKSDSAPKTVMWYPSMKNYQYGQVAEVRDSIRFINERLTDRPNRCFVMLWTGHANPFEDAVQAAYDAGCINLNGGVFRWDPWHDSVGFVSPWSRRVGKALQIYAGAANENDFDGFFDTMPGSFGHIDITIERTGSPRILKPADIYIHFYSAEKRARLLPTHDLIQRWALKEPTAPVFASTYANAVKSAVDTARIIRTEIGWRFEDFGHCRSVRFEHETREIALTQSKGVLGTRRVGHRLWIHLARPNAEIVFAVDPPRRPHVEEANCILEDADIGARRIAVTATAHNPRLIVFAGLPPSKDVGLRIDDLEARRRTDAEGRLTVRLEQPGRTRVVVQE
jgi:hypothetical protein